MDIKKASLRRAYALVATALRHDGCSVVEAVDGAELIEPIGSALLFGNVGGSLAPISLVISDIRMPGRTELEVLRMLRLSDITVSVLLMLLMLLMTAYADHETRADAAHFGADALLAKPFDVDELRGLVQRMLPPWINAEALH